MHYIIITWEDKVLYTYGKGKHHYLIYPCQSGKTISTTDSQVSISEFNIIRRNGNPTTGIKWCQNCQEVQDNNVIDGIKNL